MKLSALFVALLLPLAAADDDDDLREDDRDDDRGDRRPQATQQGRENRAKYVTHAGHNADNHDHHEGEEEHDYDFRRKLQETAKGLNYKIGHWSYGDYRHGVDAKGPHDCKDKCDADRECHHWQYNFDLDRCDHKGKGGQFAHGGVHWIVGPSRNFDEAAYEKENMKDEL